MKSLVYLKAAYIFAWTVYLGYFAWMIAKSRRLRDEMKDLKRR